MVVLKLEYTLILIWNSGVFEVRLNEVLFDVFRVLLIFQHVKEFLLVSHIVFNMGRSVFEGVGLFFHLFFNYVLNFELISLFNN